MDLERLFHTKFSRGEAVRIAAEATASGLYVASIKTEAPAFIKDLRALDMRDRVYEIKVTSRSLLLKDSPKSIKDINFEPSELPNQVVTLDPAWSSKFWFPLDPNVAAQRGLPTLYARGGGLDIHDQLTGYNARGYTEAWANRVLYPDPYNPDDESIVKFWKDNPGARAWLGWCAQLGFAGAQEPKPVVKIGTYNEEAKVGVLVGKHGDDEGVEVDTNIVPQVIRKGKRVVVDLPHIAGSWFRVAYGVNARNWILVTEFGAAPIYRDPRGIVYALIPLHGGVGDPKIKAATAPWGNPELNPETIAHIVNN